jgi:hypothetical protein
MFINGSVLSQSIANNSSVAMKTRPSCMINHSIRTRKHIDFVSQSIPTLEKKISASISILEYLQSQVTLLNSHEKSKIAFYDEIPNVGKMKAMPLVNFRHIEFLFEAGKVIELKIFFHQQKKADNLYSIVRYLSFSTENIESIKVRGLTDTVKYADMSMQTKQFALKSIVEAIETTIIRLDIFIRKAETEKKKNERRNLAEI